jgi:hypothetical protein
VSTKSFSNRDSAADHVVAFGVEYHIASQNTLQLCIISSMMLMSGYSCRCSEGLLLCQGLAVSTKSFSNHDSAADVVAGASTRVAWLVESSVVILPVR